MAQVASAGTEAVLTRDSCAQAWLRHGTAYLFISHDLKVVRAICHQVMVMRKGRIVESGNTELTISSPREDYTRRLVNAALTVEAWGSQRQALVRQRRPSAPTLCPDPLPLRSAGAGLGIDLLQPSASSSRRSR
ncbi:hypothetical protein [Roseomonas elaeocarpi]|uniref:Oligopeptide/dipeptide ABC transporter C-terminal domain-containing protein n=1 Tax=Roseomonas elaeocarpi TaxID=907779 RepID=A0ABV6JMJ1_9PROT